MPKADAVLVLLYLDDLSYRQIPEVLGITEGNVGVNLPWTWYLTVPVLVWIGGYMLADRMRHKRQPP